MRPLPLVHALVLGLALTACQFGFGPTPETFEPAQRPAGVQATLRLSASTLEGELLEVRDSTLLLLTAPDRRIIRVPLAAIHVGQFEQARERVVRGRFRSDADRITIRRLSRFPAGLREPDLTTLLEAHGQASAETVGQDTAETRGLPAPEAVEQTSPDTVERDTAAFLRDARDAADRYFDRAHAVADGYRKVGPDFPAMGEHWVQPGRLVSGRLQPSAPPILSYIEVRGRPVLVGVAYALPLSTHEHPPPFPWPGAWHDHTETLDEESLLVAPGGHSDGPAPRLAMLHAWVGSENPDGIFGQHNWLLPFQRLGLQVEVAPSEVAARAASLVGGGTDYYTRVILAATAPNPPTADEVGSMIEPVRAAVEAALERRAPGPVTPAEMEELGGHWHHLLRRLEAALGPDRWARVRPYLARPGHHDGGGRHGGAGHP